MGARQASRHPRSHHGQCSAVKARDSMCGLRGVRVGEASHPGPRLGTRSESAEGATQVWQGTLPTVVDSVDRSTVGQRGRRGQFGRVPEDVLDALEFDLTRWIQTFRC